MHTVRSNKHKALNSYIRYFEVTQSSFALYLKQINSLIQNHTSGMSCGAVALANPICMKDSTNSRKSITSLKATKSHAKTDWPSTFKGCKIFTGEVNGISCQRPMCFQTNMATSFNDSKSTRKNLIRIIYGL